jgi:hypothetical protein
MYTAKKKRRKIIPPKGLETHSIINKPPSMAIPRFSTMKSVNNTNVFNENLENLENLQPKKIIHKSSRRGISINQRK